MQSCNGEYPATVSSFWLEGRKDCCMAWICKVSQQIVNGTSASVFSLEPGSHDGQHSQAAILDLLGPQFFDLFRGARAPAQGIEPETSWVAHIGASELVIGENWISVDRSRLDYVCP